MAEGCGRGGVSGREGRGIKDLVCVSMALDSDLEVFKNRERFLRREMIQSNWFLEQAELRMDCSPRTQLPGSCPEETVRLQIKILNSALLEPTHKGEKIHCTHLSSTSTSQQLHVQVPA